MCTRLRIWAGSVQHPAWKLLRDLGNSQQQMQIDDSNQFKKQIVTNNKPSCREKTSVVIHKLQ